MKKLLRAIVIVIILSLSTLLGCRSEPANELGNGASDSRAMQIANRVIEALGGLEKYNAVRYLSFHFVVERDSQRVFLRAGQCLEPVEHGRAQLMQPGEGELHLRLDARDPCDATLRGPLGDVLQQRRLADPRLAAQDLHRALPRADPLQLAVQCL